MDKKMNLKTKILLIENALDELCKATGRDIFVMLPDKEDKRIPYLVKEIKTTLERLKND